jgi:hypothetical protein
MAKRKIYERLVGRGENTTLPITPRGTYHGYADGLIKEGSQIVMCPFTNYIPLSYFYILPDWRSDFYSSETYMEKLGIPPTRRAKFRKKWESNILAGIFQSSYSDRDFKPGIIKRGRISINKYLSYNGPVDLERIPDLEFYCRNKDEFLHYFPSSFFVYNVGRCIGFSSPCSLFEKTTTGFHTPRVLAVVRPEDYIWMKYNILVNNVIDLSRVIILIDGEMDTMSFENKKFKALYKSLLPKILSTNCQIWRVPHDFITENCFLPKFKLKHRNIQKRKEEMDRVIEEFYNSEEFDNVESNSPSLIVGTPSSFETELTWISLSDDHYATGVDPVREILDEGRAGVSNVAEALTGEPPRYWGTERVVAEYAGRLVREPDVVLPF